MLELIISAQILLHNLFGWNMTKKLTKDFVIAMLRFTDWYLIIGFALKLRKGKALRKHSPHGKIAGSVLLKLFISGNERCNTTDVP